MSIVTLCIPQIGEGLMEARLVARLKGVGDAVRRDEVVYQMETDKAVMDVESPQDGVIVEWLAEPDQVLPIGAAVVVIGLPDSPTAQTESGREPDDARPAANSSIPPRTRAYAREKGLTDADLTSMTAASGKLMPEDIDRFLAVAFSTSTQTSTQTQTQTQTQPPTDYQEQPLSPHQRILASRLVRSASHVVPGTIMCPVCWDAIERERVRVKASGDSFQPSAFTMFAFAVASSLPEFPLFRSSLVGEDRMRTYEHVSLGIAVGLPTGDLVVAAVENADALPWREFADRTRERIELARSGKDQATYLVTISLTNMQGLGVREAIPVVVAPSVATLFLGEVYTGIDPDEDTPKFQLLANLSLTFDHRLINGVAAAKFLAAIKSRIETISAHLI